MNFDASFIRRRVLAGFADLSIEISAGVLGGYFGALMGALMTTLREDSPGSMGDAIRSGLGNGFFFWFLSFSFLNRVVYQGISRASIGKHFVGIELNSQRPVTWGLMTKRWVASLFSMAFFGAGYWSGLFTGTFATAHDYLFGFGIQATAGDFAGPSDQRLPDNIVQFPTKTKPAAEDTDKRDVA